MSSERLEERKGSGRIPPRRSICLISSELETGEKSPCVVLNCKPLGRSFPKLGRRETTTCSQPGRPPTSPVLGGEDAALPSGRSWSGRRDTKQVTPSQGWSGWSGKEQKLRGRTWGARRLTDKVKFKPSVWSCPLSHVVSGQPPPQPHTYQHPLTAHLHTPSQRVSATLPLHGFAHHERGLPGRLSQHGESRSPNPGDQPLPPHALLQRGALALSPCDIKPRDLPEETDCKLLLSVPGIGRKL